MALLTGWTTPLAIAQRNGDLGRTSLQDHGGGECPSPNQVGIKTSVQTPGREIGFFFPTMGENIFKIPIVHQFLKITQNFWKLLLKYPQKPAGLPKKKTTNSQLFIVMHMAILETSGANGCKLLAGSIPRPLGTGAPSPQEWEIGASTSHWTSLNWNET